jgi:hypothetical protein
VDTYQLHECNQAGVLRHVSSRGTLASLSHAVIRLVMFMWVCNGAPKWQLLHTNQLLINDFEDSFINDFGTDFRTNSHFDHICPLQM